MAQLWNIVKWKYIFRNQLDNTNYLPELYINSERNPDKASPEIEACMNEFQRRVRNERGSCSRKHIFPDLTPMQSGLLKILDKNEIHKRIASDKNYELAIIET